jgi:transposase
MRKNTLFIGLDVHAESISVAVAEAGRDGEVRSLGRIENRPESIRKLIKKLGSKNELRVCYEAGPCGYVLYWQLIGMGVHCEVIAPTLIPKKPGERVKTDRLDATKLARCYRAGELTAVWVPDSAHEALRDLVRAREAAKGDRNGARHRLSKFLLRHGRYKPSGMNSWTLKHMNWLKSQHFEELSLKMTFLDYLHEVEHQDARVARLEQSIDRAIEGSPSHIREVITALQALRGVAKITAVGVVSEVGNFSRFAKPQQLMGYTGSVPSEHSSGGPGKARRGGITKTGNRHLRRLLTEAAWSYRYRPGINARLKSSNKEVSEEVKEIAWKAQHRLHDRYWHFTLKGKPKQVAVTAVARELLGFMWSIGVNVEQSQPKIESSLR